MQHLEILGAKGALTLNILLGKERILCPPACDPKTVGGRGGLFTQIGVET
jgi:hypothetical protein